MRALSVLGLIVCIVVLGQPVFAGERSEPRTITVEGDAVVRVAPDHVILTVSVATRDSVLLESKKENDDKCKALVASLERIGVDGKDIRSDYVNIAPRYDVREFLGYDVNRSYVVTIRNIDKFEEILSGVLESGVKHVHGIQFRTSELKKHRILAREKAIAAARDKATGMAGVLGEEVGIPLNVRENHTSWGSGYNSRWGAARGPALSQVVVQASEGRDGTGSFEPGTISVRARVTVSFELD